MNEKEAQVSRLKEWAQFIISEGHVLKRYPHLLFQQAFNQAGKTTPSHDARSRMEAKAHPWIEWRNKPAAKQPWRLTLEGHQAEVHCCAYSPDGKRILSGSDDKTVRVWEADTGQEILALQAGDAVSRCGWSTDGKRIFAAAGRATYAGGGRAERTILIWDAETGIALARHPGFHVFAFLSRPGLDLSLAAAGANFQSFGIWEIGPSIPVAILPEPGIDVSCAAISPDARWVALISPGKGHGAARSEPQIRFWETSTGKLSGDLIPDPKSLAACQFSPDSEQLAVAGRFSDSGTGIVMLSVNKQTEIVRLTGSLDRSWGDIRSLRFSHDGKRLAATAFGGIKIWDVVTGREVQTLRGHAFRVNDSDFSPDDSHLVSASGDETLIIWPLAAEKPGDELMESSESSKLVCVVSPGGDRIAVISGSPNLFSIQDVDSKPEQAPSIFRDKRYFCVAFSPDGSRVVAGSEDHRLTVWNVANGKELMSMHGHTIPVTACAFSKDGRGILSGSCWPEPLILWDGEKGSEIRKFKGASAKVTSCVISPDDALVAASFWYGPPNIKIWDMASGKEILFLSGHDSDVHSCSFSPDGNRFVSGSNGEIKIWNVRTGGEIARYNIVEDSGGISAVDPIFSWDGRFILLANSQNIRILCLATGDEVGRFVFSLYVGWISLGVIPEIFAPARRYLLRLALHHLDLGPAITTLTHIYQYEKREWTRRPVARCAWCGRFFSPSEKIIDNVQSIARAAAPGLCCPKILDLPVDAWDEPRLKSTCVICQGPIKYNPFIINGRTLPWEN
jgi:WD40 repeat protein